MVRYQFTKYCEMLELDDDKGKFWIDMGRREIITDKEEAKEVAGYYGVREELFEEVEEVEEVKEKEIE